MYINNRGRDGRNPTSTAGSKVFCYRYIFHVTYPPPTLSFQFRSSVWFINRSVILSLFPSPLLLQHVYLQTYPHIAHIQCSIILIHPINPLHPHRLPRLYSARNLLWEPLHSLLILRPPRSKFPPPIRSSAPSHKFSRTTLYQSRVIIIERRRDG